MPTSVQTILRRYLFLWVFLLIIVIGTAAYLLGYRVGPGITLARVGNLDVTNLPKGATIYVDQVSRGTTAAAGDKNVELVGGNHTIIVSVTGDYPWNDLVSITSGKTTKVNPILITMQPDATALTGDAKTAAIARVASTTLPTESAPLTLANGCAHVYVSNNQVIADPVTNSGCTPPPYLCVNKAGCASTIIFSPVVKLSAVLPYPGRQDAILVAFNNVLYALALDPRSPQYFAPVLTATQPQFGTLSDGTVIVENGSSVFSIKL
ncbi:MAG: PEGA domain-containing protein [Candidatus Pacebacteria bacterium]|nr:PEGA domain-containing protein [Candidatus Paceibacterota bacterium]